MLIPHITDVLGWLAYCFCGYAAFLVVWTLWKGKQPEHAARWMKFLASVRKAKGKVKGVALPVPIWVMAISLVCSTVFLFAATRQKWPTAEHHALRIERRVSDNQWWIVDAENPDGFMYYACPDFPNSEWIKEGYFAKRAKWQVKGDCNSIKEDGLAFYYDWKPDGTAKTITEERYQ